MTHIYMTSIAHRKAFRLARAIGFASIIIILAIVCGSVLAFSNYFWQHRGDTWSDRERAAQRVERDTTTAIKRRFMVGASCGACFGILYVVRCVRRKEDP